MSKYINPYTDFGFKKLFGEEANKDLLIDFLNQLLPAHHQIASLDFRNPEIFGEMKHERKAIFDIHCEAKSGEKFIVERQKRTFSKKGHYSMRLYQFGSKPKRAIGIFV